MQPKYLTTSGSTGVVYGQIDTWPDPVNVGMALTFPNGSNASATVSYTFEDIYGVYPNPQTSVVTWHTLIASTSATTTGSISFPVAAIRLQTTAGTSVAMLSYVQSGLGGP